MPVMVARKRTRGASQGAARPSWVVAWQEVKTPPVPRNLRSLAISSTINR